METKADWPPSITTLTAVGVGKGDRPSLESSSIRAGEKPGLGMRDGER
jgi:hypothetical protein